MDRNGHELRNPEWDDEVRRRDAAMDREDKRRRDGRASKPRLTVRFDTPSTDDVQKPDGVPTDEVLPDPLVCGCLLLSRLEGFPSLASSSFCADRMGGWRRCRSARRRGCRSEGSWRA